ncbi:MAG TPA: 2-oxo-4-hydroxy-4-carboxy-5-ureidoimidazoline decarboxylase [Casimicrobiaceae bacterium]|nr:2-oxo-4-hydroxy-4-carboxy-5-ureidoimidazoline decarboxylase [Casimicrobiaceae bacterium]
MPVTLEQLNASSEEGFAERLRGIYEHSPWVVERVYGARPFASLAALKRALVEVVRDAGSDTQLALIRAHPQLAGRAMQANALTRESSNEQAKAGLMQCTPDELDRIAKLNAAYEARFGFPFILAVRGPRGDGLRKPEILATFERRLEQPRDVERAEALRNIHRIAELRLDDAFGFVPTLGERVFDWADALAMHSDPGYAERGELTVTYLSDAHRAAAAQLQAWMRDECGFDEVSIDAVGNVVALYHGADLGARRLLTGSHYDTVRNAGRYDGRLGILVPMAAVRELAQSGRRLPFGIEVVAFAEEEGQRYAATFLGSSALIGQFDSRWLDQRDADGVTMREAMQRAALPPEDIARLRRDPAAYLGFVEVHIEQGPVLTDADLPLGVVTSINGCVRYMAEIAGIASHAGTTPMRQRHDAAAAAAEIVLEVERRASQSPGVVGTVGMLDVPNGSINVVPGRCLFSIDVRAATDAARDACAADVLAQIERIAERRSVQATLRETLRAAAAPCDARWRALWEAAVADLGVPVLRLPSGAGHDAMKLSEVMPQAMLFVRGQNGGISHNPLESITSDDADLAVRAMGRLLERLAATAS